MSASPADVDAQRRSWADEFVVACIARGLQAIALTDHHEMIMVPYVQRAIADRKASEPAFDLWLFPGMELTCRNGVQSLIIFDADLSEEWRREAQSLLGIVVADLEEKAHQAPRVTQLGCTYPHIATQLDAVDGLRGKYIVLPNVSQGGQHTVVTAGAHADFKAMPYVGGYLDRGQSIATLQSNRRKLSGEDRMWGNRFIYPLPTSDSRSADFAALGTNSCWIKLAAPTAEAIRQAFLGHQSRISIDRPVTPTLSVRSLSVNGSAILVDGTLNLSPELNSFIGGRGSGKSSYLEYVSFGLGRSCHDMAKSAYSGNERLIGLMKDTLVSAGGTIELVVSQDGANFYVQRTGGTSYQPRITYPDGTTQELSLKELRSLFPAVVFSQGELSEIGKQAGKRSQLSDLLQFVEPEHKKEDERLTSAIETAKLKVRAALQAVTGAWNKQAQLHKLQSTKLSLDQRITALQKTLPQPSADDQTLIARHAALVGFEAKRQQAEKQVSAVMDDLTELWRTSRQPVDLGYDLPEATKFAAAYAAFNNAFKIGIESLGRDLATHRSAVVAAGEEIVAALSDAKSKRDAAMEKFVEHRSVTAQVNTLQQELQMVLNQIGEMQVNSASPDEKFAELTEAREQLKAAVAAHAQKTQQWANQIEQLSDRRIQAQLNVDGNWTEIIDAIDIVAAKSGSQEGTRHRQAENSISSDGAWGYLDAVLADCVAALRWTQLASSGASERPACATLATTIGGTERTLSACLDQMDLSRAEAIATATPKPDITLFYCDDNRRISFEKASEGQRAAALLFMLLEQAGGPLIVDQPEGDLDNKIVSQLAEKLHSAKQRRQIIFASHNANIVVNGSSELVVGLDVTGDARRGVACSGAIDTQDVCDKITEIMEGGEKAFRDRKDKYGY
jgi:chromosome segregation protein